MILSEKFPFNRLQNFVVLNFGLFTVLNFFLAFLYSNNLPEEGIIVVQSVFCCFFLLGLFIGLKFNLRSVFIFVFLYQIILTAFLYFYFHYFVGSPFGYEPIDALSYRDISKLTMHMNFSQFIQHLQSYDDLDLSDYGYPFVQRLVFMLLGDRGGIVGMVGLNVLLHLFTLYYLYKLSKLLLNRDEIKFVVLLWGINICAVWLNVSGLKEQIFVFLVIAATYYMYIFDLKHRIIDLLLFFCFVISIWFFRYYVSLFFLIIFLFSVPFKVLYNRLFLVYCIGVITVILFGVSILVYFMPELEVIERVREKIAEDNGQNTLVYHILSFVFAFLGPIPSFLDTPKKMNLLISVYSIWKLIFSIFGIYAAYYLIKIKRTQFYPLINLILFNTLLTIVSGYALSYRYVYITMPLYLILMVYGVKLIINRKLVLAVYVSFCLLASLFFNLRNF